MRILLLLAVITLNFSFAMSEKQNKEVIKVIETKPQVKQEEEKIESVKFYSEKPSYKKGENVCFVLENNSNNEILLPSTAPYAIFEKEKPEVAIFSPVSAQVITVIKPKEKKQWCWNQKDIEGKEVPSGDYFVRLTIFDKSGKKYFLKSEFSIKL